MWRESLAKQASMMETITRMKESVKTHQNDVSETIVRFNSKISDTEYKIASLTKQLDSMGALGLIGVSGEKVVGDAGGSAASY